MNLKFDEFELDHENGTLRRAGVAVPITAQAATVLALLVERRGETVTREEIRQHVWPDVHVGFEDSINTAIRQVRAALGDSAARPRFIGTVRGEGYRFIGAAPSSGVAEVLPARRREGRILYAIAIVALLASLTAVYFATRPRTVVIDQKIKATVTVTR